MPGTGRLQDFHVDFAIVGLALRCWSRHMREAERDGKHNSNDSWVEVDETQLNKE